MAAPSRAAAVAVATLGLTLVPAAAGATGSCAFDNEPVFPNYVWDPTCVPGMLGCAADGRHVECRFCGGGAYANVSCRASSCLFVNEPFVPYFWDPTCKLGELGCWADGVHNECRFCGKIPYTSIPCPEDVGGAVAAACTFRNEPAARYEWDPSCRRGMLGCLADGVHEGCRYCEEGAYAQVSCAQNPSEKKCTFANEPTVPYFWDPSCTVGQLGCLADGIHAECRFCAHRPFETVSCPGAQQPPAGQCTFPPLRSTPLIPFYWEPACTMGVLGCWADGLHAQCRYCGTGVYSNITCPPTATFPGTGLAPATSGASGAQAAAAGAPAPASAADARQGALGSPAERAAAAEAAVVAPPALAPAMDLRPAGETQVNGALRRGLLGLLPAALACAGAVAAGLGARAVP